MIIWEMKKIFYSKRGVIALILFLVLSISMVFIKPKLEGVSEYTKEGQQAVQQWNKGNWTEQQQFDRKIQLLKESSKNDRKDEFSKDLKEISNEKISAIKVYEYKDVKFWKVFNHRAFHPLMCFIMLIIIIIIFSNIYTEEIVSIMDNLILSSKNKNKVLYSKLALSILIPLILYGMYLLAQFAITHIQYGKPINGGLQVIRIVDNPILINNAYSIYGFMCMKISVMLMTFITLGIVGSLFSFITINSVQSTSGFFIFIFLGKAITLIKGLPKEIILVFSRINYIDLIFNFNELVGMYFGKIKIFNTNLDLTNFSLIIMIFILCIAILSCITVFKKFLTR